MRSQVDIHNAWLPRIFTSAKAAIYMLPLSQGGVQTAVNDSAGHCLILLPVSGETARAKGARYGSAACRCKPVLAFITPIAVFLIRIHTGAGIASVARRQSGSDTPVRGVGAVGTGHYGLGDLCDCK